MRTIIVDGTEPTPKQKALRMFEWNLTLAGYSLAELGGSFRRAGAAVDELARTLLRAKRAAESKG